MRRSIRRTYMLSITSTSLQCYGVTFLQDDSWSWGPEAFRRRGLGSWCARSGRVRSFLSVRYKRSSWILGHTVHGHVLSATGAWTCEYTQAETLLLMMMMMMLETAEQEPKVQQFSINKKSKHRLQCLMSDRWFLIWFCEKIKLTHVLTISTNTTM